MRPFAWICVALATAGCGPRNFEDCKTQAAQSPTERGVTVAVQACYEKFELPRKEAELKAAKARSERIASKWPQVQAARSLESVEALIGKADSTAPARCDPIEGGPTPPANCVMHYWVDARAPEACASRATLLPHVYQDGFCRWQVQASSDGTVWLSWNEPN